MYLRALVAVAFATFALSAPVYAADAGPGHLPEAANANAFQNGLPPGLRNGDRGPGRADHGRHGSSPETAIAQVPELGGASAGLALLLLGGLIALRRETRKPS